jgi:hemerythrin-like domain-containing protein
MQIRAAASHGESHDHHQFETPTDVLKSEHRIIERVLDALDRLTKAPDDSPLEAWGKAIDFARNFADTCHHLKEEKLLFPALEERGIPREGGPIGMMLAEHEEGRGYVRAMAHALESAAKDPLASRVALRQKAAAYVRLLRQHIQKEDEVLFQMADAILSPDEQNQLLREFEEHELGEMGPGVHEKYLKIAEELGSAQL